MRYTRKTKDYWDLEGLYNGSWNILTAADTFKEIKSLKKDYALNEPATPTRIRKHREKIVNS